MSAPASLTPLIGHWAGQNRLWVLPGEPDRPSAATAQVALAAQGQFILLSYTWAEAGQPQDGVLIIGLEPQRNLVSAAWIDSWHMQDKIMSLEGTVLTSGAISFEGSYAAPPGPDWGWRITIEPGAPDAFRLTMHNVSPRGAAALAVEAAYARLLWDGDNAP